MCLTAVGGQLLRDIEVSAPQSNGACRVVAAGLVSTNGLSAPHCESADASPGDLLTEHMLAHRRAAARHSLSLVAYERARKDFSFSNIIVSLAGPHRDSRSYQTAFILAGPSRSAP